MRVMSWANIMDSGEDEDWILEDKEGKHMGGGGTQGRVWNLVTAGLMVKQWA